MPSRKPDVLMVGTDIHSKGGISSVIRLYQQGPLFQRVLYLPSYTDGDTLKKIRFYFLFLCRFVISLLTNPAIRIVHIHSASYGSFFRKSWVLLLARLMGKKTIMHIHGAEFHLFFENAPNWQRKWISMLLGSADSLVALSSEWKETLSRISNTPNVRVIYNPTLVPDQLPDFSEASALPVRFLFMGRLGQRKGVYDLIGAVRNVQPNIKVILYGDGEVDQVRASIIENRVKDRVEVGGWISGSQKDDAFRQADVLILPSYNEGLPISILEAMAYGKPIIATNVGGISEAVEENVNGFLLQPGDCHDLARRIEQLAESEELRRMMGRASYEKARRQFALPVVETQLGKLYDELLV